MSDSFWDMFNDNDVFLGGSSVAATGMYLDYAKHGFLYGNYVAPISGGSVSNSYGFYLDAGTSYSAYNMLLSDNEIDNICSGTGSPISIVQVNPDQIEECWNSANYVPSQDLTAGNYLPSGTSIYDANSGDVHE